MENEIKDRKGGQDSPFLLNEEKRKWLHRICVLVFCCSLIGLTIYLGQNKRARDTQKELQSLRDGTEAVSESERSYGKDGLAVADGVAVVIKQYKDECAKVVTETTDRKHPEILQKYQELYDINPDMAGWLTIEGTVIDYPVMQTMEDECYYLDIDFYKKPDKNGCLIMDTDSVIGTGTMAANYENGDAPSTNLIIHGHTMKSGEMFGNLMDYEEETYGKSHRIIRFDSLYEERQYELISVFYSQVYYETDEVFKYYKFFEADTQEAFDDWYSNIKTLSLYDTGVTAEMGDEFITLSCCSYHVEDGRFVVVGKRIK